MNNRASVEPHSAAAPRPASRPNLFWSVFGRVWAVWTILIFILTMLVVLIPFLLFSYFRPDPQKTRAWVRLSRIWMGVFLPLAGCPLRVRGREKFAAGQSYVVVCNHNALVDVPVSYPFIPGGNKTIAKIEMASVPIFGLFYRTGSVLVDRKSETSRRDSFVKMKEVLDMGLHMCIYPEGTRNKTAEPLKSFHDGAFRLALSTGHAIMPAIIFNTRKVMPASQAFFFRPCPLYMDFLDPVALSPGESLEGLKKRVFDLMSARYAAGPKAAAPAR
jgi:1-acyl-sn-glycerol-3-phosphate acyltransferase